MSDTFLIDVVETKLCEHWKPESEFTHEHLARLSATLMTELGANATLRDSFESSVLASLNQQRPELNLVGRGWKVRVSLGVLRTAIAAGMIATLLATCDVGSLPAAVVPAVIPLLFDIERVRLTRKETAIWWQLIVNRKAMGIKQRVDQLYSALPDEIRREVSYLDFLDFVEKCDQAGLVDIDGRRFIEVHPLGQASVRITFE